MESLQVSIYDNFDRLSRLKPAWDDLLAAFPAATIFCTWEWLAAWWRAYGGGQQLRALAFFESPDKLVGLAPLVLSTRSVAGGFRIRVLRLLGDGSEDSDNLDLLVRRGYEEAVTCAFLDWLGNEEHTWDVCELNTLPAESPVGQRLRRQLNPRSWKTFCCQQPCSAVSLPDSWESYLSQLSPEDRYNLARYQRRLERRYRVRFYKCTQKSELPARLEALFRLHRERWRDRGESGAFETQARCQFYRELSEALLARERLEFWFLELNGKTAAAQFGMRYGQSVFQLQEGFDPAHYSDRVGFLLRGHVLQNLIADGVGRYDFLGGQSSHKSRWGATPSKYLNIRLARKGSPAALYLRCAHYSGQVKEKLRAHLSDETWRVLHSLNYALQGESPRR